MTQNHTTQNSAPELYKLPRLFVSVALGDGACFALSESQAHYLRNVLRREMGSDMRLFDGQSGEWLARITVCTKKAVEVEILRNLKQQPTSMRRVHLIISPIRKRRQDILIEKIVELGVTDIHPVMMERTQGGKINETKVMAQILEAAEQCERLTIPILHPSMPLRQKMANWDTAQAIHWCDERGDGVPLKAIDGDVAFLVGPEGGFSAAECEFLRTLPIIQPISLGDVIYRVETAVIICLVSCGLS